MPRLPILLLTVVCCFLVTGNAFSQQKRRKPSIIQASSSQAPQKISAGDAPVSSPTGKIVVSGAHTGLRGILNIHVDNSLQGPIGISVVNQGNVVPQSGLSATGFELSRRTEYAKEIQLAAGVNIIKVMDMSAPQESVMFTWTAVEEVPGRLPEQRPTPKTMPAGALTSTSGKLVVVGLHDDEQAMVSVTVDNTLAGPFKISLVDESGKSQDKTVELKRNQNNFMEKLRLKKGKNIVTVTSTDDGEKAETVTLPAWDVKGSGQTAATPSSSFKPSATGSSEKGELLAEATRINGSIQLNVRVSDKVSSFKVEVLDKDNKTVLSKEYPDLKRGENDYTEVYELGEGSYKVRVTDNVSNKPFDLQVAEAPKFRPLETTPPIQPDSMYTRAILGFEQVGASSAQSESKPFMDLFFTTPLYYGRKDKDLPTVAAWGNIRLSALPEQVATIGTFSSNFTNTLSEGKVTNNLVQSFEFLAGLELRAYLNKRSYFGLIPGIKQKTAVYLVGGAGAISPLNTTRNNTQIFAVPSTTSSQRTLFVNRYGEEAANKKYIAFVFPERDRFLRQFYGGVRFKTHYLDAQGGYINRFPATLDVMIGQNEATTGGSLKSDVTDAEGKVVGRKRRYVVRLEAFYPFPIKAVRYLYLFGATTMQIGNGGVKIDTPLFLDTAPGNVLVTNDDVFITPTLQTSRDNFRIGVGVNLIELFKSDNKTKQ